MKIKSLSLTVTVSLITLLVLLLSLKSVYAHRDEKHSTEVTVNDTTYSAVIQPLFAQKCAKCHGAKSPEHMEFIKDIKTFKKKMRGPKMNSYSHLVSFVVWPDTGSLMRALDDGTNSASGKPGKMYRHLGKTEEERQNNLKLFKSWVGHWTLNEWSDIGKEEINQMKLTF
jgi:hypothetical protein